MLVGAIAPQFGMRASSGMLRRALCHHPLAVARFLVTSDAAEDSSGVPGLLAVMQQEKNPLAEHQLSGNSLGKIGAVLAG